MDKLRSKDDFLSKGIVFSEIKEYYYQDKRTYTIPYNPKTREFQESDYRNIKEFPKDLIAIQFPAERFLDKIGWNKQYGLVPTHGLAKQGLKLQSKAKQIPWEKTFVADLVKRNLKAEKNLQKDSEKPQQKKGRKM